MPYLQNYIFIFNLFLTFVHIASSANQNNKMVDLKNTWAIVTGRAISGDAFNFAAANSAGPRRLSPEGAVSIRLRDNNGQLFPDTTYSGKVYTFLPLPEEVLVPSPALPPRFFKIYVGINFEISR